jgi:DNA invertase Pin-like site-specific DNA recombinase
MNRNRLANGSEIEAAEADRATRPLHWPRAPTHKSRRNALRCSALRLLTPHQIKEARQRLAKGESTRDLAKSYGVSVSTISRLVA